MLEVCPDNEIQIRWIESICDVISELHQGTVSSFIQAMRKDIAPQLLFHPKALIHGCLFSRLRDLLIALRIPLVKPPNNVFAFIATKLAYTLYQGVCDSPLRAATEIIDIFLHSKSDIFEARKEQPDIPKTPPQHSRSKRPVHTGYVHHTPPHSSAKMPVHPGYVNRTPLAAVIGTNVLPIPANVLSPQCPVTMDLEPSIATKRELPVQQEVQQNKARYNLPLDAYPHIPLHRKNRRADKRNDPSSEESSATRSQVHYFLKHFDRKEVKLRGQSVSNWCDSKDHYDLQARTYGLSLKEKQGVFSVHASGISLALLQSINRNGSIQL